MKHLSEPDIDIWIGKTKVTAEDAARASRNQNTNYQGAQPPGSPLCAGFAHNGVEVPSAATEESSQTDKVSNDSSATELVEKQLSPFNLPQQIRCSERQVF